MNFRNGNAHGRLFGFFGSLSIQTQLIASYIVVILLPTAIFSAFILDDFYKNALDETVKTNAFALESELLTVRNHMEAMERTVQLSLSDKEVLDYLSSRKERDAQELVDLNFGPLSTLQMMLFNNPYVENIRLFTNNPHTLEIWPIVFREDRIRDRAWYSSVLNRNGLVQWDILNDERELLNRRPAGAEGVQDYVSVFQAIEYPKGNHVGVVEVDMRIEHFFSKAYTSLQGAQSRFLVLDHDLTLYSSADATLPNGFDPALLAEKLRGQEALGRNTFTFEQDGVPYLAISAYIEQLDAHLLQVASLQETHSEITRTRSRILVVTTVLIVILSVLTYFLQSFILKKLKTLRDSIKKVRNGHFDVAIDIRGSREVSDLAFHFREMVGKINQLIAEAVNKQAVTKEAELNALKNQIDAHFLYNTLENIKMLAEVEGQYTISDALTSLGGMMRYSLQWTHDRVPLREEIQHIQNYVAIMRIRYANRIELALNVPDAYLELEVLKMTLQPIVENAVKYGFHPSHRNGVGLNIEVNAHVDGDSLRIEIKDNGTGIPPEALRRLNEGIRRNAETEASPQGGGIGLRNVYQRMAMFYGRDDVLVLRSEEGAGTTVAMTIPYRGGERR